MNVAVFIITHHQTPPLEGIQYSFCAKGYINWVWINLKLEPFLWNQTNQLKIVLHPLLNIKLRNSVLNSIPSLFYLCFIHTYFVEKIDWQGIFSCSSYSKPIMATNSLLSSSLLTWVHTYTKVSNEPFREHLVK